MSHNIDLCLECWPESRPTSFPYLRKPRIIGCFSVDQNRDFYHDRSQLKYFHPKSNTNCRLDLNENMANVVRKDEEKCKAEKLDLLLKWITLNKHKFLAENETKLNSLNTDFVCFRGALTMIMCSPFEKREPWKVLAVKFRNTIFIHKDETPAQVEQRRNQTSRQKIMSSWGYKFEQFMLVDDPCVSESVRARLPPVIESEEFCCVYRTRLGKNSLVFGAEMDGLQVSDRIKSAFQSGRLDTVDLNHESFVELKTSRHVEHPRQERSFRQFKALKWWAQSFLVAVSTLVAGYRDDDGVVDTIKTYNINDFPKMGDGLWQASDTMNFLNEFLDFVKSSLEPQRDLTLYEFHFSPESNGRVKMMPSSESADSVIPSWFRDTFQR